MAPDNNLQGPVARLVGFCLDNKLIVILLVLSYFGYRDIARNRLL